ncbi:1060_t:CDS:10 [Gigaspora rosea]|nr:1060_t:CDS:10 [Gigaspora rosea]
MKRKREIESGIKPFWNNICEDVTNRISLPIDLDVTERCNNKYSESERHSSSWFNITERSDVLREGIDLFVPSNEKEPLKDDELKTRKIRVYPTPEEREVLSNWMNTSRWIYNRCLDCIKDGICTVNKKSLREKCVNNHNYEGTDLHWVLETPYNIPKKWERERSRVHHVHQPIIVNGTIKGSLTAEQSGQPDHPNQKRSGKGIDANDLDYVSTSEEDDLDYVLTSDLILYQVVPKESPSSLLLSSKLKEFQKSYVKMNVAQKWFLSSGKCVEDTIYEYYYQEIEMLFSVEEWNEIRHTVRELPEVKATSKLRQVLRTTSFLNEDEPYNCEKHYDAGLTDYEDPNEPLQKQHLESWFNINLSWPPKCNRNGNRQNQQVKPYPIEKIGRGYVHVTRMWVVKRWDIEWTGYFEYMLIIWNTEQLKWLRNSKKPSCLLMGKSFGRHIYIPEQKSPFQRNMSEETASCRHAFTWGYVSILKREKLLEIPATIEKIRDFIRGLANVWMLKKTKNDENDEEFLQEFITIGIILP